MKPYGFEQGIMAFLVAHGNMGMWAVQWAVPGWKQPDGDTREARKEWPDLDREVWGWAHEEATCANDYMESFEDEIPEGLTCVLIRFRYSDDEMEPELIAWQPVYGDLHDWNRSALDLAQEYMRLKNKQWGCMASDPESRDALAAIADDLRALMGYPANEQSGAR